MSVTVYGYSDDLIEIEGDIDEEFPLKDRSQGDLVSFSNGTVLRVTYTSDGLWKISVIAGAEHVTVDVTATDPDDDAYSDVVTINGDVSWVTHGSDITKAKK